MKERNKYDIILFLLIILTGFGTIGGAFTPVRIMTILCLPLLLSKWKCSNYIKPFLLFFLFFYAYCLVSLLWTPDTTQGLKELVYYPIQFLYFFEILVFSRYAIRPLKSLSWGWTMMIFFCSFIAIWEITTDNHLSMAMQEVGATSNVGDMIVQQMTASVTFHNPNAYVTILCYSFPWIVYLSLLKDNSSVQKAILYFTIIMSVIVIMFNMSRGGFLSFIIMGLIYLLLSPKTLGKTVLFILMGCIIAYILINYGSQVFAIMEARVSGGGLTHDDARSSIWSVCLQLLVSSMFLGVGVGGLTTALGGANTNIVASPHSLFFEMLTQYGVLFTLIFILFMLKEFSTSWRIKDSNRRLVLLMSLIAMPVYTIIDSSYMLGIFNLIATIYVFNHIETINKSVCFEK